ncbi:MAG: hypothetical protein KF819_07495 [Labilithrix sp.]|nr:hypothetical protein [Labilithrix sp.]
MGAPATAFAHAYIVNPPARDISNPNKNAIAHKQAAAPCGNVPRTGKPMKYDAGATITVTWEETIAHNGCYQVRFSKENDTNFVLLKQIDDPVGNQGVQSTTVTLPNENCPACTLTVRQFMQGGTTATCAPDASSAAGGIYYSCADICIGPDCDEDASAPVTPTDDGGTETDSGVSTTPTDGGGKTTTPSGPGSTGLRQTSDDGGCSIALGATSGLGFVVGLGLFGVAIARRRRRS